MRSMRGNAMNEPHAFDTRMLQNVLRGTLVALLRVATSRPGAFGPAGFDANAHRGGEQLAPDAAKPFGERCPPERAEFGERLARGAHQEDLARVALRAVAH